MVQSITEKENVENWIIDFANDVENGNCSKMILKNDGTSEYAENEIVLANFHRHLEEMLPID